MSETPAVRKGTGTVAAARDALRWAWRVAFVRLRFLIVLAVAFGVVSRWDALLNYWDKLTRASTGLDPNAQPVSEGIEYFCPMDPGVLSDWPGKCPVCNMALVRRSRGDMTPLPDGVVARTQLAPYRLHLAGVRTTPADYRPLAREVEGPGRVLADSGVEVQVFESEAAGLAEGQPAEILDGDGRGSLSLKGAVRGVSRRPDAGEATVRLQINDPGHALRPGASVRGRVFVPMAAVEPFRSLPSDPPPLKPGDRRRVHACADHPDVVTERPGNCPRDGQPLGRRDLAANQRVSWWCPMHPEVTAEVAGQACEACGGMTLVPRVVSYRPRGAVLAVPEAAVIDTGKRSVVYVERMPGVFDGVEVVLGPRCGDAYPVVRGLEPGDRVVTWGAFLVDAETRLNPSVAASYFGAARREPVAATAAPDSADKALAAAQKICPVTGKPLGSMGTPVRVEVGGRAVIVCCDGCTPKLMNDPAKYLAKLPGAYRQP
jgi:Cu(I)/Ag(I) efflux system membrane fusion protein